jgi:Protein of unknown function (DUF3738)
VFGFPRFLRTESPRISSEFGARSPDRNERRSLVYASRRQRSLHCVRPGGVAPFASVRPGDPNTDERAVGIGYPPGRLSVTNTSLKMLIWWAYELQLHQVVGGPNWLESVRWNIEATEGGTFPVAQVRPGEAGG